MANPPGMDAWLKYADQNARTPEEREKMRADIYARFGVEAPKRKRGGLAGIWDKSKNVIVPAAAGLAGFLTGGAAAPILTGALMRGADTKSLGGALRGASEGALAGLGGAAIKGATAAGMGGGLTGLGKGAMEGGRQYLGMGAAKAPAGQPPMPVRGGPVSDADLVRMFPKEDIAAGVAGGTTPPAGTSKLAGLLKPEAIGGITAGLGQAVGGYMEREAAGDRLDFEEEQRKLEQQRANRLAQLLAPMAGAQAGMVGAQYGGYGRMG